MQFQVLPVDEFNTRISQGQFEATMLDMISGRRRKGVHLLALLAVASKALTPCATRMMMPNGCLTC
jgi:hypothetical protein